MALSVIGKPITRKLLGAVGGVFGVVLVVFALYAWQSQFRIGSMQTELGALRQSAAQCEQVNAEQTERLRQCVEKRTELVRAIQINGEAANRAELEARIREQQRLRELDIARARIDELMNSSQSCRDWAEGSPCDDVWRDAIDRRTRLIGGGEAGGG